MIDLEKQLCNEFKKCIQNNTSDSVVDELINVLKRDYILLLREPLYCNECVNFHHSMMWSIEPYYCMHYQRSIKHLSCADTCKHYFSGKHEARKSIARLHGQITDDLIYK